MSAVSVICAENGIIFAADGAAYDPNDGTLCGYAVKIIPIVHLNCAFTFVGAGPFGMWLQEAIGLGVETFDELLLLLPEKCKLVHEALENRYHWAPRATVVIGGWSESRERYEAWKIHTRPKDMVNNATGEAITTQAFTLHQLFGEWASTNPGPELCEEFGIVSDGTAELLDQAARYVCACRALSGVADPNDPGDDVYGVGVFLQMTVVMREKTTSWIAHRWPDVMGERIDPSAGERMPQFPLYIP